MAALFVQVEFVTLLILMLLLLGSFSLDGQATRLTRSTSSELSTLTGATKITPIPIRPSDRRNFTLHLSYSGPAVLDSCINFTARLVDGNGHYAQSDYFVYQWSNNANHLFEEHKGNYHYSILKVFSSKTVQRGEYLMTVTVYGHGNKSILAAENLKFILTENLNGKMNLNQTLPYQRNSSVFQTKKAIDVNLNLTDTFNETVTYEYYWYLNNKFKRYTDKPNYRLEVEDHGKNVVSTVVYVSFNDLRTHLRKPAHLRKPPRVKSACAIHEQSGDKCGKYSQVINAKDRLTSVYIDGETDVAVNNYTTINISCLGSTPVGFCLNVSLLYRRENTTTVDCIPKLFVNSSFYQFTVQLKEKGWHNLSISVYNDVSYLKSHYYVFAYNVGGNSSSLVTIPVVFSLLVTVIVIIGGVYLWKLKKKPFIEVADFEFHPSIARTDSLRLSNVLERVKVYLKRGHSNSLSVQSQDSIQRDPGHMYETL